MAIETWIIYKTEHMSAVGWEERRLMPRDSLTNILEENWSAEAHPNIPQPGDRTRAINPNMKTIQLLMQEKEIGS